MLRRISRVGWQGFIEWVFKHQKLFSKIALACWVLGAVIAVTSIVGVAVYFTR